MKFENESYITGEGIYYKGVLRDIKRSKISFQPIYEAFTNSLEAVKIKSKTKTDFKGEIRIRIYSTQNTDESLSFSRLEIEDNGIGFNDEEFNRFVTYKDFTKGFKNLGSGRIQYVHNFDNTKFISKYQSNGDFREREFVVSKDDKFLAKNSITFHKKDKLIFKGESTGTRLIFEGLLDKTKASYHSLNDKILKDHLLKRYVQYFCLNKESLPTIKIEHFIYGEKLSTSYITIKDIPKIDKTTNIDVEYSKLSDDGKNVINVDKSETFTINAYKLNKSFLKENQIKLTSKDEVIENFDIDLQLLTKDEIIDDSHFLFLISSDYLDEKDKNERGEIDIPNYHEFSSNSNVFYEEEIILDLVENQINGAVYELYPEIEKINKVKQLEFEKLKQMFLLSDLEDLNISPNDSDKKILEKFYTAEAKKQAELDANLKHSIDRLNILDTTAEDYSDSLEKEIENIVRVIPLQNKKELTHYVARRKLVLELFALILDRKLSVQNDGSRNKDEALLHNLIFQQSNDSSDKSDLWIINEDFIYFQGISESKLSDLEIDGEKLLRDDLTKEEEEFIRSLGEDRYAKRPDILLFPEEQKCIIIEFKNPSVSVSDHLNQINNYATLLKNFTTSQFNLTTFYGYLIGEKINALDVRTYDADFKDAYNFDYLYRPAKTIANLFNSNQAEGSLYTEVLKYSTLLERAKMRNKTFIEKITNNKQDQV
ncbi:ATP-binding protein [Autumnicola psychrophila]|uniref:ATP-binding protein n=1 Tax=Autumnicola psychrophila TaxID=3075592 RepID=A0ABU3DNN8_9FLAO|nr:hypothetical protein [Zunongwangia sp. F225]MDT0685228.1 hypothetical protein [Zunongwangia sp. F225]